ncbi:predicted protein [Histoplasma capsulatum H143]|uniref:Uncharacterized protein n=1 Tax=Ajellomyces capsulatus (strain H143) TaxID=544712 RepID=C6HHK0_AJECH|nr:predicted protein [Histoplasma capsulatum H143]
MTPGIIRPMPFSGFPEAKRDLFIIQRCQLAPQLKFENLWCPQIRDLPAVILCYLVQLSLSEWVIQRLSESVHPDSAVHMTRTGGWCLIASASVIYLDHNVVDANDSNSQALQSAETYDITVAGY